MWKLYDLIKCFGTRYEFGWKVLEELALNEKEWVQSAYTGRTKWYTARMWLVFHIVG